MLIPLLSRRTTTVSSNTFQSDSQRADLLSLIAAILMHTIAKALTEELGEEVAPAQIHDFELSLFDVQPSAIGGALVRRIRSIAASGFAGLRLFPSCSQNEFIFSPRLDNLFSSYAAIAGLVDSVAKPDWGSDGRVSMIALWDNEEIGSVSAYGGEQICFNGGGSQR